MNTNSTIDFSTYSDAQLEYSLSSIDRDKFEQNYLACRAEIEKRKADGRWQINRAQKEQQSLAKIRKWVKFFALVQALGGILGIGKYLYMLAPKIVSGQVSVINLALLLIAFSMLAGTAWVGWRYWRNEEDKNGLWKILLGLQIPAFNVAGFGYEFYSGFTIPLGFAEEQLGVSAKLGSNVALFWTSQNTTFHLTINLAAIVMLGLLGKANKKKSRATPSTPHSTVKKI